MADPVTIGLIVAGTGAALQGISQIKQGNIAAAQGELEQKVQDRNQG